MDFVNFSDRLISYDQFLKDVAASVVNMLKSDLNDPEFVSQRKAYEMFGRSNVERWRKLRKVSPCIRPGKVEYRTAELRLLQRVEQDYF